MAYNRIRAAKKMDGNRKRRVWTKRHVQELRAHSRARTPVARMSRLMKRTSGALRQKAFALGLSLGHRR
jgi:hypothetical protein